MHFVRLKTIWTWTSCRRHSYQRVDEIHQAQILVLLSCVLVMTSLSIQFRFPPKHAPRILRRIPHMRIHTYIQANLHRTAPIQRESGQALPIRIARHRKISNIALQHSRKRRNQRRNRRNVCRCAIPECVADIKPVQRGRHLELVRIRLIAERARQLVRVAREDSLRDDEDSPIQRIGVRHAPIIHGGVQVVHDFTDDLRRDAGVCGCQEGRELRVSPDTWVREQYAFVRVVPSHDLDVLCKGASGQEHTRVRGHEDPVDRGAVRVFSVGARVDLGQVCGCDGFGGEGARFGDGTDV